MKKILLYLALFVFSPLVCSQTIGKPFRAFTSVCLEERVAIEIVNKSVEDKVAADKIFDENEKCQNLPIEFTPISVVFYIRDGKATRKVVKIKSGDTIAYWLTSLEIKGLYEA